MSDYKEKIRKLLNLAESPNEHEARSALLAAQRLMAEHKITERQVKDSKRREVKNRLTKVACSKRKNPWILSLSRVVGENYCCKSYQAHEKKKQTYVTAFIGFEEDLEICISVFQYAIDCVLSGMEKIRKENMPLKTHPQGTKIIKRLCDSYGYGFVAGMDEAFAKQKDEKGWALVLAASKEVNEAAKEVIGKKMKIAASIYEKEYGLGYEHGKKFHPEKRIHEKHDDCV